MLEKLESIDLHYQNLEAQLGAPETYGDPDLVARLNREQRELEERAPSCRPSPRNQRFLGDPYNFICSGGVNPPGIKVLPPAKHLVPWADSGLSSPCRTP